MWELPSNMKWSGVVLCLLLAVRGNEVPEECLTCICEAASECDLRKTCSDSLCGPFGISRGFWLDSGSLGNNWESCSLDLDCAAETVRRNFKKNWKDCDGDGRVNCHDFARLHYMGAASCSMEATPDFTQFQHNMDTCLDEIGASVSLQNVSVVARVNRTN